MYSETSILVSQKCIVETLQYYHFSILTGFGKNALFSFSKMVCRFIEIEIDIDIRFY